MTFTTTSIVIALLLGSAACAPIQPIFVSDPVGPLHPGVHDLVARDREATGALVVYSDFDGTGQDPDDNSPHSSYKVFLADGQLLRSIVNIGFPDDRAPATVLLPAGRYSVIARALGGAMVTIETVIAKDQTTVIDLNNEMLLKSKEASTDWVRLPNGSPIGTRAR